ncbi:hypothetical protein M514_23187 [Trichuris suis]|uniref:Reverse transcriptase domain-containing protein n=1 Tax=Trichuris suis TaxID=68888 RepID=A0A085N539_9BILA|nr:hypothetical protein M514_23187 [Trichuris suis]
MPIQSDPTPQTRTELRGLLQIFAEQSKEDTISSIRNRLYYVSNSARPELYGLPKVRKPGVPLRPVVCSVNSVTSQLCTYLKGIIQPLTGGRSSHVSNRKDFCAALKSIQISKTDFMVSYDVKDLFTSILIPHTLNILQSLLDSDSSLGERTKLSPFQIVKLVSFCVREGNYFRFQGSFFRQNNGAPMGSPLSPVLAELFMEHLKETAFEGTDNPWAPRLFKRYVDDIFAIVKKGQEEALLEYLNSIFPGQIAFTIEKEVDNKLPFLDVLVHRRGACLRTTVHRKPTHSDRYLHFSSHHPVSVKRGVVTGMVDRAVTICDPKFLNSELQHIATALQKNGYPQNFVTSTITRRLHVPRDRPNDEVSSNQLITIPYYCGLGERLQRLGRQHGYRVYFKSSPSLRSLVRNDKIRLPFKDRPGVVYEIKCGCNASYIRETGNTLLDTFNEHYEIKCGCNASYIRETGNTLLDRFGDYMKALNSYRTAEEELNGTYRKRRGSPRNIPPLEAMEKAKNSSAVVEHSSQCSLDLHPRIICRESQFRLRQIKESLFIRNNPFINRDKGVEVSSIWTALISKSGRCSIPTDPSPQPLNTLSSE